MVVALVSCVILLNLLVLFVVLRHKPADTGREAIESGFATVEKGQERLERGIRDDLARSRAEATELGKQARDELRGNFATLTLSLRETADAHSKSTNSNIIEMFGQHKGLLDSFSRQLADLTQMNERKLESVRETVEKKLSALAEDNGKKLEEMRKTVDEKLHQTLEKRLGESFQLVSERLELVQKGLGEMQTLAAGVGDLKKVLTNVKTRGTMGEIQLDSILEQFLSPEQYQRSAVVRKGSAERVDFAVKLPGKDEDEDEEHVLLPIDSKFPLEDYQRLMDAQEAGDLAAATEAAKLLEARIRAEAKSIHDKYLNPPVTTDFAVMFLPVEGLFAEVLRRSGLWDALQREHNVTVAGPTTIAALLNSLQMGFHTLTIQKRSSEVWKLLGTAKSEFGKFGDVLEKTKKKLQESLHTIDSAAVRTRAIERSLRTVEALPTGTQELDAASGEDMLALEQVE